MQSRLTFGQHQLSKHMSPFKKTHNFRNLVTAARLHLITVCLFSNAAAADYTYTLPASGTTQWSSGTDWGGATAPVAHGFFI